MWSRRSGYRDDADQSVTQVVRGEDLADNTARQVLLQRALGLPMPGYLHTPLVLTTNGEKLSKQNGAAALETEQPLRVLNSAAAVLGRRDPGAHRSRRTPQMAGRAAERPSHARGAESRGEMVRGSEGEEHPPRRGI